MKGTVQTRASLRADLEALGLKPGDAVLVHAALRAVGRIAGGPDSLIDAIVDAVGPDGTLLAYCDWQFDDDLAADPECRAAVPAFDPARSRATRDHGAFPEMLRTTPGAHRSGNPGASICALGARAEWFTANHPLDYGYGANSPFGKLVEAGGKTMLLGAPRDTMTLLHHAEHLANIPGKRIVRGEFPTLIDGRRVWRTYEEFNTSEPVVAGLPEDYFATIVTDFLATGGSVGKVGDAETVLVDANDIVAFAVDWLETRFQSS